MALTFIDMFVAARRSSTPLIAVRTPDPRAAMTVMIAANLELIRKQQPEEPEMLLWDVARGLVGVNNIPGVQSAGEKLAKTMTGGKPDSMADPITALLAATQALHVCGLMFFSNAQHLMDNYQVVQAIWNLRDPFKTNLRALVMLCPDIKLPAALAQDVTVIDEPLPDTEHLRSIISRVYEAAHLKLPVKDTLDRCIDATCGLSAFAAEQVCAMSVGKSGMDENALWERKRQAIEQTPGLSVWRGGEKFSDIGGCDNVKRFIKRFISGKKKPRAFVFQDEIEKAYSGAGGGDLSGTTDELLGSQLSFMQDHRSTGLLFIGHPGAAKSAIAKAAGNEAGIPTIQMDLGAMKGGIIGESNANMRTGLKVIEAVSQGRAVFIATCNNIKNLPPELRRRFKFGTFFFDLPTAEERDVIWNIYLSKFGLKDKKRPEDVGWTGAEIENCCDIASQLDTTLQDAATYIVPLITSARERIEDLRNEADGRFISASYTGPYKAPQGLETEAPHVIGSGSTRRAIMKGEN